MMHLNFIGVWSYLQEANKPPFTPANKTPFKNVLSEWCHSLLVIFMTQNFAQKFSKGGFYKAPVLELERFGED